jgi:hypothetical protein
MSGLGSGSASAPTESARVDVDLILSSDGRQARQAGTPGPNHLYKLGLYAKSLRKRGTRTATPFTLDEQDVPNHEAVAPRGKKAKPTARPHQQHASSTPFTPTNELEQRCLHLQNECESLQRSVKIFARDAKWDYSAPCVPRSHLISRGFDMQDVARAQQFIGKLKRLTCAMRRDCYVFVESVKGRKIALTSLIGDNAAASLLHDDTFLPHWREFANALQLYLHSKALHCVSFSNMQLDPSVIDLLTPALTWKSICRFELSCNAFASPDDGCRFAVTIIEKNPRLKEFVWAENQIGGILVESILSHPSLDTVSLKNCFGGGIDAYDTLCSLLSSDKDFIRIALESSNIQPEGRTEVPAFLAANPRLQCLNLTNNRLGDDDAGRIAQALKRNTNLRCLRLGQNDVTDTGVKALRSAVFNHASLNAMADSNHSCRIEGLGVDHFNKRGDPKSNRAKGLYRLLSWRHERGINVTHLDDEFCDDSLKLVPNALGCVHRYAADKSSSDVHPLSIVYEIMRSWKMPTLYENNGVA